MAPSYEYRRRARNLLENSIFSNSWLYLLLAIVILHAVISLSSFVVIGPLLLIGPVTIGLSAYLLTKLRSADHRNDFSTLLEGARNQVGDYVVLGLLQQVFIFLWSLLFIIPGIVKHYSYSMCYYIKLDHPEYSSKQCLDESERMMNGHKWELFCLDLSFIGWCLVGALTCGIGSLWVSAYVKAAGVLFYDDLKRQTCGATMAP